MVDIAVLYPIHGLQAAYYFGPGKPYTGGVIPAWADYMDVGERLSLDLRHDFTYLHPETLEAHCRVADGQVTLQPPAAPQQYRLLIVPGTTTISVTNLAKIAEYFDQGGQVIATTRLPDQSVEPGQTGQVRRLIEHIFGTAAAGSLTTRPPSPVATASSVWQEGGFDAAQALDGDPQTRWNAQDQQSTDQWLEVDFGSPRTFAKVVIQEAFDRVTSYAVQYWDGNQWKPCVSGSEIGSQRTLTFSPITASRVRLFMDQVKRDTPSIAEFAVIDAKGNNLAAIPASGNRVFHNRSDRGGNAWFVETPSVATLRKVVDQALPRPDVAWDNPPTVQGGHLSYLHKEIDGRQFWFFANSSDTPVDTTVTLHGKHVLQRWDPHTGRIEPCPITPADAGTAVRLQLAPVSSVFLVSHE